jgi:uncharacterized membrane protein YfcA
MEWWQIAAAGVIGLLAGLLGGLAGVGGSILILPALGIVFGYPAASSHHGYMAAAMVVNLVVAIPAALRHRRAGAIRPDILKTLIPATAITMALGVLLSNQFKGWQLQVLLAVFILGYCGVIVRDLIRAHPEHHEHRERVTKPRLVGSASVTGLTSGLLGLGGGIIQVPMLQVLCGVGLRQAIATSSAVMCLTAGIAAAIKLATLPGEGERIGWALALALAMTPTAVVGARIGASLTHRLRLHWVRAVIAVMLVAAAVRIGHAGLRMAGWI